MLRIALDAMGGDAGPEEIVAGALVASERGVDVVLVGDRERLAELDSGLPIVHAPETIEMGEDPARAIREKKQASIMVAARLVAEGKVQGLVSAGSTGAALAASALVVGRLPGVQRPAIASIFPVVAGGVVVLDVGANIEAKPEHLAQFGAMGTAVAATYLDKGAPRVALLNIGEEAGKGRDLEKRAFDLLSSSSVNFVGNVEGRHLADNMADVIVTDGFTGNVLLKTAEGAARFTGRAFTAEILGIEALGPFSGEVAAALGRLGERLDPESYGGAHLVGAKGVVVIAHGSSSHVAIANALLMAAEGAGKGLVDRIAAGLSS